MYCEYQTELIVIIITIYVLDQNHHNESSHNYIGCELCVISPVLKQLQKPATALTGLWKDSHELPLQNLLCNA